MGTAGAGAGLTLQSAPPPDPPEPLDSEKFRTAVQAGDVETVARYLDRDPALRYARDAQGNSVYTLACLAGHTKVAEALLRSGLILDIFEAAAGGNVPRAAELAKMSPGIVRTRSVDGRTPLHFATAAGQPEMVAFLNAQGADLSAGPESPLLAADHPDPEVAEAMARTLLSNGSDPNAKRQDGRTALHLAAARGNAGVTRFLIHRGATVEAKDANGQTPKDVATGEAARVLRQAGSIERAYYGGRYAQDLRGNKVTRDDTNGLPQNFINEFVSVAHFNFERVKRMHNLCPSLLMTRATWDELAIEAAAHMGLVPLTEYLAQAGSPVSTCTATILGLMDLVKSMVEADRDRLRERGAHDLPLVAYTAFGEQRAEIAEFLLKAGADVEARAFGQTTLHIAASKGHVELAKLLLDRGADVNAAAKSRGSSITPLAVAIRSKQSKVADLLRDRGGRT